MIETKSVKQIVKQINNEKFTEVEYMMIFLVGLFGSTAGFMIGDYTPNPYYKMILGMSLIMYVLSVFYSIVYSLNK